MPIDAAADATRPPPPRSSSMWPSGATRTLPFSRAHNPVWSPPAAATLRRRGGKSGGRAHPMQIGIAGIGKMGAAIAQRLIEVGHTVAVWNRSADTLKPRIATGGTASAQQVEAG